VLPVIEPLADVALLAPGPEEHLIAGLQTCAETGFVAFGTDAGMTLAELRNQVDLEHAADILFYASHSKHVGAPVASFRARFIDYRGGVGGKAEPSWAPFRPPTTANDGAFLSFYLVSDLQRLEKPVPLGSLKKHGGKSRLAGNYIPIGPLIIDTPF
jgi:hypothetical protein